MHHIHLADDLKIRFVNKTADFDIGVEVGSLGALMAIPMHQFSRRLSVDAIEPATHLAAKLGYGVIHTPDGNDAIGREMVRATFKLGGIQAPKAAAKRFAVVGGMDFRD